MATYEELFDLRSNSALKNKITVAVVKKAQALLDGATPSIAQVTWAKEAINNPIGKAESLMNYVLAANSASDVSTILGATDTAIQNNVDAAVDVIVSGGV